MVTPPELPKPKPSLFTEIKNKIRDRNLPEEIKPGAKKLHQVREGAKFRDQTVVSAANDLSSLINNMADRGQYPVLDKWRSGTASQEEIKDAQQIIQGLRTSVAKKYGIRIADLEQERNRQVGDFLG